MIIARVHGNVVATKKNIRYERTRIMLVQQVNPDGSPRGGDDHGRTDHGGLSLIAKATLDRRTRPMSIPCIIGLNKMEAQPPTRRRVQCQNSLAPTITSMIAIALRSTLVLTR